MEHVSRKIPAGVVPFNTRNSDECNENFIGKKREKRPRHKKFSEWTRSTDNGDDLILPRANGPNKEKWHKKPSN
jgi:hypothetical protein